MIDFHEYGRAAGIKCGLIVVGIIIVCCRHCPTYGSVEYFRLCQANYLRKCSPQIGEISISWHETINFVVLCRRRTQREQRLRDIFTQ